MSTIDDMEFYMLVNEDDSPDDCHIVQLGKDDQVLGELDPKYI